jgi:hypothetical protein
VAGDTDGDEEAPQPDADTLACAVEARHATGSRPVASREPSGATARAAGTPARPMTGHDRIAKQRVGSNEAMFRRINETVETDYSETGYAGLIGFLCECGDSGCEETIEMTRREYESVRGNARRFAIVGDHVIENTENIVERHQRYSVVEKHEDVADLVERSDPRR